MHGWAQVHVYPANAIRSSRITGNYIPPSIAGPPPLLVEDARTSL
ncbi:hypothetical protein LMG31841_00349 [Paraburkholderia saeva]|uniref:Uncharacterized protein n=1 Tax=Paraburkholderia saeva TaxID=2777537 RepID=A0A9N8RSW6_9BURK|nr:hypothetical protein R70241_00269 [Paraburkholderia saeva]CAG4887149.1 hypothetical protein LMG31841_00349 [Paraburkholderia saeva]